VVWDFDGVLTSLKNPDVFRFFYEEVNMTKVMYVLVGGLAGIGAISDCVGADGLPGHNGILVHVACTAAAVAVCGPLGVAIGGPYAGVAGVGICGGVCASLSGQFGKDLADAGKERLETTKDNLLNKVRPTGVPKQRRNKKKAAKNFADAPKQQQENQNNAGGNLADTLKQQLNQNNAGGADVLNPQGNQDNAGFFVNAPVQGNVAEWVQNVLGQQGNAPDAGGH
jgi:hypothetical protein